MQTILLWSTFPLKYSQAFESQNTQEKWPSIPPSMEAFENTQINITDEKKTFKELENPLGDSYIHAYNCHSSNSKRCLVKRDTEEKSIPQTFQFQLEDAKEPDETTKELIRTHRARELHMSKAYSNVSESKYRTKRTVKNIQPRMIKFEFSDAKEPDKSTKELIRQGRERELRTIHDKNTTRPLRSSALKKKRKRTQRSILLVRDFKSSKQSNDFDSEGLIPSIDVMRTKRDTGTMKSPQIFKFQAEDAMEPDQATKELIRMHRARELRLNKKDTNVAAPKERTKRSTPEFIKFELSDAKVPNETGDSRRPIGVNASPDFASVRVDRKLSQSSMPTSQNNFIQYQSANTKEPVNTNRRVLENRVSGSGFDLMNKALYPSNETQTSDDEPAVHESKQFFVYQAIPVQSKRASNSVPIEVRKIIGRMLKDSNIKAHYNVDTRQNALVKAIPVYETGSPTLGSYPAANNYVNIFPEAAYGQKLIPANVLPHPIHQVTYGPTPIPVAVPHLNPIHQASFGPTPVPIAVPHLNPMQQAPYGPTPIPIAVRHLNPIHQAPYGPTPVPIAVPHLNPIHQAPYGPTPVPTAVANLNKNQQYYSSSEADQQSTTYLKVIPRINQVVHEASAYPPVQTEYQPETSNRLQYPKIVPLESFYQYGRGGLQYYPSAESQRLVWNTNHNDGSEKSSLAAEQHQLAVGNENANTEQQQIPIANVQEFRDLSTLIGKSPTDQMHGLAYLLAKQMQLNRQAKEKRPHDNTSPILFHPENSKQVASLTGPLQQFESLKVNNNQQQQGIEPSQRDYTPIVEHASHFNYVNQVRAAPSEVAAQSSHPPPPEATSFNIVQMQNLSPNYKEIGPVDRPQADFNSDHEDGLVTILLGVISYTNAQIGSNTYLPPTTKGYSYPEPNKPFPQQPGQPPKTPGGGRPVGPGGPSPRQPSDDHEHVPGMPFDFEYAVNDVPTANDYSHKASSDGDVVSGEYQVALPDGRRQIVRYTADWKTGFHADVSYEGEPNYPQGPSGKSSGPYKY